MIWIGIVIFIFMFVGIISATEKLKFAEHDEISWFYISFGMYTWFQVLVLAPFWLLFALGCVFFWNPMTAIKTYVLIHCVRSLVEIINSAQHRDYINKIIPSLPKLSTELRHQMYQLIQMSILIFCLFYLLV